MNECGCSDLQWKCSATSTPAIPRMISNTTDIVFDVTDPDIDLNTWILNTHNEFIDQR